MAWDEIRPSKKDTDTINNLITNKHVNGESFSWRDTNSCENCANLIKTKQLVWDDG